MIACGLLGIIVALEVAVIDIPVYSGRVFLDYGDPDRPGHIAGVTVTLAELLLKAILALVLLAGALWFWIRLKRTDPPTQ